jgi:hypothetical protein
MKSMKFCILICTLTFLIFPAFCGIPLWRENFGFLGFAQQADDGGFTLDTTAATMPLPKIFKPSLNLSGRGSSRDASWPRDLASPEALATWQKDLGYSGIFRLQYNLWEIENLSKDKEAQEKLLASYEKVIQDISAAGGIVILDIFGTPAGLGRTLDIRSTPSDLTAFKKIIKARIRYLSCEKRYNIWYEVWNAPDIDNFFLGRQQDYLNLYRAIAEAIKELEAETKTFIPLGGPAVAWWFQNLEGNTILAPERSLVYDLIRFCYHYRLPLDFITWHSYSTDPKVDAEMTGYNRPTMALVRDWLAYFKFDKDIPLIVDEWNYDNGLNVIPQRKEDAYVAASYIPARLKNMQAQGLGYQLFFSLEDFQNKKEGVVRNVGMFWFDPEASHYKGGPKAIYNVFRMLGGLGSQMYAIDKTGDEFVGAVATKTEDGFAVLIYNYIDQDIFLNYVSRNIASVRPATRKVLLRLAKSNGFAKIMRREQDIARLRADNKTKAFLRKALELNDQATQHKEKPRGIKFTVKNLKENYLYQRYAVDSGCSQDCDFAPVEEKEVAAQELYRENLSLKPYSVNLIILKKKPPEIEPITAVQQAGNVTEEAPQEKIRVDTEKIEKTE